MTVGEDDVFYDDLMIELFVSEISENVMQEYLSKLFPGQNLEKMNTWMQLIDSYFTHEGSINAMAESLFMHKNTLQYKLKKMAEMTGKDIRLPSNSAVFYMATEFYHRLSENDENGNR